MKSYIRWYAFFFWSNALCKFTYDNLIPQNNWNTAYITNSIRIWFFCTCIFKYLLMPLTRIIVFFMSGWWYQYMAFVDICPLQLTLNIISQDLTQNLWFLTWILFLLLTLLRAFSSIALASVISFFNILYCPNHVCFGLP